MLRKRIEDVKQSIEQINTAKRDQLSIQESMERELADLGTKKDQMLSELSELRKKLSDTEKDLKVLSEKMIEEDQEKAAALEELEIFKRSLDKLSIDIEQLKNRLFEKRMQEVELRNYELPDSKVPQIDTSRYRAPIPKPMTKVNSEVIDEQISDEMLKTIQPGKNFKVFDAPMTSVSFARALPFAAVSGDTNTMSIIQTDNYKIHTTIQHGVSGIMATEFSPSDKLMVAASFDGSIRLYSVPDFSVVQTINENKVVVNDACFITDDKLVTCSRDMTIKLYDVNRSSSTFTFTMASTANTITMLNNENLIMTGHCDGSIRAWDFRTHNCCFEISAHKSQIVHILGIQQPDRILSLSMDKTIEVTDLRYKCRLGSIPLNISGITSEKMKMGATERTVITGGITGNLYEWDLETFKLKGQVSAHKSPSICVSVKKSQGLMASGDKDGIIRFWIK